MLPLWATVNPSVTANTESEGIVCDIMIQICFVINSV